MEIEKYSNEESRYSIELCVYLSHEIKNYSSNELCYIIELDVAV